MLAILLLVVAALWAALLFGRLVAWCGRLPETVRRSFRPASVDHHAREYRRLANQRALWLAETERDMSEARRYGRPLGTTAAQFEALLAYYDARLAEHAAVLRHWKVPLPEVPMPKVGIGALAGSMLEGMMGY